MLTQVLLIVGAALLWALIKLGILFYFFEALNPEPWKSNKNFLILI